LNLDYTSNNTFAALHFDTNKYLFCRGPVGSGKSSGCIWHLILNSFKQNPDRDGIRHSRYGVIRASYPALKSTVIKSWQIWFKNIVKIIYDTPIRGEMFLDHPDGVTQVHIELVFLALDRDEDVNKLQSLELTGCHINEAAEIPRGVHQMLKSRIDRYPAEMDGGAVDPFIICDYNSVPTDHWLYNLAEEVQPAKHSFYHQPPALIMALSGDGNIIDAANNYYKINPEADNLGHYVAGTIDAPPTAKAIWFPERHQWWVQHLSEDYYADQVHGADPDWVNVMILNNYGEVRAGKPVFPEYLDGVHFDEQLFKPLDGVPIIVGMDLGLTPAASFMQLTPTGQLIVFDEIVTEDCSIHKFCEDYLKPHIFNTYPKHSFTLIVDPAAVQRSQNDLKSAAEIIGGSPPVGSGLPYRLALSNNDLKRREAVVYFLRKLNGFSIGPNCQFTRKGFISGYAYDKKRIAVANVRATAGSELFKDKPGKNIYSHIHDALQYGAMELSEGRSVRRKSLTKYTKSNHRPGDSTAGY